MMKANYHTHSTFCDGRDTPEEIVKTALRKNFTHLGFSGHMDPDIHMDLGAYTQEIRRLKELYRDKIDIFLGIELDNLYDPICAAGAEYVIGSTHFLDVDSPVPMSVDNTEEIFQQLCHEHFGDDYYRLAKAYYDLEARVYDRLHCTFVGHFDLVTRFNDRLHVLDETDKRYTALALEAMEYLVSEGVPFEINCGAVNRGRKKELYPNRFLLTKLSEMGGRILLSSDAHQKELLDGGFDLAVETAVLCGFTHVQMLQHDRTGNVCWAEIPLR